MKYLVNDIWKNITIVYKTGIITKKDIKVLSLSLYKLNKPATNEIGHKIWPPKNIGNMPPISTALL